MRNCRLYAILDRGALKNRDTIKVARDVFRGGADIVQFRDKVSGDGEFLKCARALKNMAKRYSRLFIINDRVDIARVVGADGVHLGQSDMPIKDARRIVGKKIIGMSTHSLKEANAAQKSGADYIGIGPVFKSRTRKKTSPISPPVLKSVNKNIDIPVFAIGGISLENIAGLKKRGVNRAAVISSINRAKNVYSSVKKLKEALNDTVRSS
ncbi:MAG: thiamine phosphate synthase [Candidatus Omnitrophota bacterium]|nr:thiamine phosphate synthase [Candidatus Omnitrophota bacterium]